MRKMSRNAAGWCDSIHLQLRVHFLREVHARDEVGVPKLQWRVGQAAQAQEIAVVIGEKL
jgi:hypothetical protein